MSQQFPPPAGGGYGPPGGGAPNWPQQPPAGWPGAATGTAQPGMAPGAAQPYREQQAMAAQPPIAAAHGYTTGYQGASSPRQPGVVHALSAPPGMVRVLWVGVVLMLVSFVAKQILVDLTVSPVSTLIEEGRLREKQSFEVAQVDARLDGVENEIRSLLDEGVADELVDSPAAKSRPKRPARAVQLGEGSESTEGSGEAADSATNSEQIAEKLAPFQKTRAEIDKLLMPERKKIRDEFRPKIVEAARDALAARASLLGRTQTSFALKLFVDLLKLFGATIVVFSALGISNDPEQGSGTKTYAAVLGGIAFVSMAIGGVFAALFG